MNSKLNRLLASLLVLTTNSFGAGININGGTCSNDCQPCCDKVTGFVGPPHLNSLGWGVSLGLARYPKPTSLTPFGQAAFEKNGNLPDFNQLFGRYFSSDPLQQNQIRLELSQTQLSAATFHPSCLFLQSEARFETLKKPAAGGFPEYIHQIVTDDAFTLIDVLPDSGWRLRVWRRPQQLPTKSLDGFYNTANFVDPKKATPLTDVIFKRPDGSSGNNTLIYIQKETTGVLPGTRIITNKIVQTLAPASGKPLTVVSELFEGEGTTGELLSDETLTYPVTERGTKAWDYTIVRVTRTSSVNENGTNASLTTTAKTREDYDDFSTTAIGGQLGMKRLVSKTEAFEVSGQTPQTTTYTYINTPTNPATHGRLRSTVNPDGSWTFSEYAISSSTTVPIITEYSGWKDLEYTGPEDLTMAQRNAARKTVTTITANQALVETTVAGQLVSQSRTTLGVDSGVHGTSPKPPTTRTMPPLLQPAASNGSKTATAPWRLTFTPSTMVSSSPPSAQVPAPSQPSSRVSQRGTPAASPPAPRW